MKPITRCMAIMATLLMAAHTLAQETFREVAYDATQTTFQLNAPSSARKVVVRLYEKDDDTRPLKTVKMKLTGTDQWTATVKKDLKGIYYTFDMGQGECAGTFAKAVGVNGKRGVIIDMADTDPEGWEADKRPLLHSPVDLVIYEMHHRDFSVGREARYPGKFLALTEPWAIKHLKDLGVNAVHILPSFDYASVDESKLNTAQYNWGYDPVNYNVPDGSYATDPYTPTTRVKEFKQMVQALHRAGIRVILDVVYNHTFDLDNSNFQKTYPGYYYRYQTDGSPSNGSGCGNETASEKPLMRQFMLESIRYWAEEYHIDGFRVDLMGVHDMETMNLLRKETQAIDSSIFIYGEGWSAGACAYPQEKLALKEHAYQMPGIAVFSDDMRDALRGPFSDDHQGAFLAGIPGEEESLKFGIVGGIAHSQIDMTKVNYDKQPFATSPTQQISYVSCHDDMCLVDRLRTSMPGITDDELIRLDKLAQTAVFLSQGVPFMLSGEEMLRDKKGVHNSYNSPDSINVLPWDNLDKFPDLFHYYRDLILLRRNHPAFRLGKADLVREHLTFLPSQDCMVAFQLSHHASGDKWDTIIVALNTNTEERELEIPQGEYTIVARDGEINEKGLGTSQGGKILVSPQSAFILHN